MTGGAKRNEVVRMISPILILKNAARLDVMDVKAASIGAMLCSTVNTRPVTAAYIAANSLPVATMCQFFAASVMGTVFAYHKFLGAFNRAKAATVLSHALKSTKGLAAVLTVEIYGCYLALVGTLGRTMANSLGLLIEAFATNSTIGIGHLRTPPSEMAFTRTKDAFHILACTVWLSLKRFATVVTGKRLGFAEGVDCALTRTVIDYRLVGLELFTALETSLDH